MQSTIMVIDGSNLFMASLHDILGNDYNLLLCKSVFEALEQMQKDKPDFILLDLDIPKINGISFIKYIKNNGQFAKIPIMVLSAYSEVENQVQFEEFGILESIRKPVEFNSLKSRIEYHLKIVDENKNIQNLMDCIPGGILRSACDDTWKIDFINEGMLKIFGLTEREFRRKHDNKLINMIAPYQRIKVAQFLEDQIKDRNYVECEYQIEYRTGEMKWVYHKSRVVREKNGEKWMYTNVIDVTPYKNIENSLKKSRAKFKTSSQKDSLTQLLNRRTAECIINEILREEGKYNIHYFIIIDIDDFKGINDKYGHLCGDKVLVTIAELIKSTFRATDILSRFGGDEFSVFVCNSPDMKIIQNKTTELLDKIAENVEFENQVIKLSCSIGISVYPTNGRGFSDLYQKADMALYSAKKNGKNCALYYEE